MNLLFPYTFLFGEDLRRLSKTSFTSALAVALRRLFSDDKFPLSGSYSDQLWAMFWPCSGHVPVSFQAEFQAKFQAERKPRLQPGSRLVS